MTLIRRLAVLLAFSFVGVGALTGAASAAPTSPPPLPVGECVGTVCSQGAITVPGLTHTVYCPALSSQRVVSATAEYYVKGKLVSTSTDYTTRPEDYTGLGDPYAATFVTPKKAEYVFITVTCTQADFLLTSVQGQYLADGQSLYVGSCPAGMTPVVDLFVHPEPFRPGPVTVRYLLDPHEDGSFGVFIQDTVYNGDPGGGWVVDYAVTCTV